MSKEPKQEPEKPEKPKKKNEKPRSKTTPSGRNYKQIREPSTSIRLDQRCIPGPHTQAELYSQIDTFLVLNAERREGGKAPYAHQDAADYFKITIEEYLKILNSPGFIRYMDTTQKIEAKQASRVLTPLAVTKLRQLGQYGMDPRTGKTVVDLAQDKVFLSTFFKFQEMQGFDKVEIGDSGEIDDAEGAKLVERLLEILTGLNEGVAPNIHKIMAFILATQGEPEKGNVGNVGRVETLVDGNSADRKAGPDSTVDTVPQAVVVPEKPKEVRVHARGKQAGKNGLVGVGRLPVDNGQTPIREDAPDGAGVLLDVGEQQAPPSNPAEVPIQVGTPGEDMGLQRDEEGIDDPAWAG